MLITGLSKSHIVLINHLSRKCSFSSPICCKYLHIHGEQFKIEFVVHQLTCRKVVLILNPLIYFISNLYINNCIHQTLCCFKISKLRKLNNHFMQKVSIKPFFLLVSAKSKFYLSIKGYE